VGKRQPSVLSEKLRSLLQRHVAKVQLAETLEIRMRRRAAVQMSRMSEKLFAQSQFENAHACGP